MKTINSLPAIRQWFGSSKVVDADGAPVVVYHGTGYEFEQFDFDLLARDSDNATASLGFFFSGPATASSFAEYTASGEDGANVIPVLLKIVRPYEMSATTFAALVRDGGIGGKEVQMIHERIKSLGHDGIHIKADLHSPMPELHEDNWVVFGAQQIASAIGIDRSLLTKIQKRQSEPAEFCP